METDHDRPGGSAVEPAGHQVIELAWTPELGDYVEAYRVRNRANRVSLKLGGFAVVALLAGVVGAVAGVAILVGAGFAGFLTLGAAAFLLEPYAIRAAWRRNPALHAPTTARVDPAVGVSASNGASTREYPWRSIDSVTEADSVFVVQLEGEGQRPFVVLAKRGLADPDQLPELRRVLNRLPASTS